MLLLCALYAGFGGRHGWVTPLENLHYCQRGKVEKYCIEHVTNSPEGLIPQFRPSTAALGQKYTV